MEKKIQFNFLCNQKWDKMKGTDSGRFCSNCKKKVLSLNTMIGQEFSSLDECGRMDFSQESPYSSKLRLVASAALAIGLLNISTIYAQEPDTKPTSDIYVAQTDTIFKHIEGILTDHQTNEALPFAQVFFIDIHGKTHGTTTDFDGRFELKIPMELIGVAIDLHFKYFGYRDMEVVGIRLNDPYTYMNSQLTKMESQIEMVGLIIVVEEDQLFQENFEKDFSGRIFGREEIMRYPGR